MPAGKPFVGPLILTALLLLGVACRQRDEAPVAEMPSVTPPPAAAEGTRVVPIVVADEPREVVVTALEPDTFPLATLVPVAAEWEETCSSEGCALVVQLPAATVGGELRLHLFAPAGVDTASEDEPFVTGPRGLLESNAWQVEEVTTDGMSLLVPWAAKRIDFTASDGSVSGFVLLGDTEDVPLRIIAQTPDPQLPIDPWVQLVLSGLEARASRGA